MRHRWRQHAQLTAAAVADAKNEVLERRRELDRTKDKMDSLLQKLHVGRDANLEMPVRCRRHAVHIDVQRCYSAGWDLPMYA